MVDNNNKRAGASDGAEGPAVRRAAPDRRISRPGPTRNPRPETRNSKPDLLQSECSFPWKSELFLQKLQGCLVHKKQPPPRSLHEDYT